MVDTLAKPNYVSGESEILIGTRPLKDVAATYADSIQSSHNEAKEGERSSVTIIDETEHMDHHNIKYITSSMGHRDSMVSSMSHRDSLVLPDSALIVGKPIPSKSKDGVLHREYFMKFSSLHNLAS